MPPLKTISFDQLPLHAFGDTIQMAGGIWAGNGRNYLIFFPKDKNDAPLEVLEMDDPEWQIFLRQTDLLETTILEKTSDGSLAKALFRKSARQIDQNASWAVYRRDGFSCRYCGADTVPLTVDHVVRWEEGGPSTEANMVACCKKCNRERGATPYKEWLDSPRYLRTSLNLSAETRRKNIELAETLHLIPRVYHVRSR